ncbi:hypothetical protein ACTXT7_008844 [Hymenolepis weldensis]
MAKWRFVKSTKANILCCFSHLPTLGYNRAQTRRSGLTNNGTKSTLNIGDTVERTENITIKTCLCFGFLYDLQANISGRKTENAMRAKRKDTIVDVEDPGKNETSG